MLSSAMRPNASKKDQNAKFKGAFRAASCTAAALALGLAATFMFGCSSQEEPAPSEPQGNAKVLTNTMTDASADLGVSLQQESTGIVTASRPTRENPTPMGPEGTWTILVYMCGSDLESVDGAATEDLMEMQKASSGQNVNFVIQAGGSSQWQSDVVKGKGARRIVIHDGEAQLIDVKASNMGSAKTLASFVSWGVKEYPAANMGLVFWDHGGGSLAGVCTDENHDGDTLTLREIDSALLSTYPEMTSNFAFIGFDACLMSTLEVANVCASYGDWLYASEDLESGGGWDYSTIGSYLGSQMDVTPLDLGKVVADSYYTACEQTGESADATLSVIDLSKTDQLVSSFGSFAYDLYGSTQDLSVLTQYVRNAQDADNFGGNNTIEGYTNMVDLQGMINAAQGISADPSAATKAIEDLIAYNVNGANHPNACGISTYWPLDFQGADEIAQFSQVATSPYYLAMVDRSAYCGSFGKTLADYPEGDALDAWGSYVFDVKDNGTYKIAKEQDPKYWDDYNKVSGESPFIKYENDPHVDGNGHFTFQLTPDALGYTAKVEACIDLLGETETDTLQMGYSTNLTSNWETGVFSDDFDGKWISLPDGQNLALFSVAQNRDEGFDIYTSPVLVNGEGTNLRIIHYKDEDKAIIDGVWDGVYENGVSPRITGKLADGDVVTPYYYAPYATEDGAETPDGFVPADGTDASEAGEMVYQGEDFKYAGSPYLSFDELVDGQYSYYFIITDIFGNYCMTDYVVMNVQDGNVTFAE